MKAAALQVLDYQPDRRMLATKFRHWHVESLLNQSADLIDRCLAELRDYCSLDYAWNQFDIELKAQEKELELDKNREGYFERNLQDAQTRSRFLSNSQGDMATSLREAQKLYDYNNGHGQGDVGWTRAAVSLYEKKIEVHARAMDNELTTRHVQWAQSDAGYNRSLLDAREIAIKKKRELAADGLPLALGWQRDLVLSRLKRSYEDALNRASVAEDGLRAIYGYAQVDDAQPPRTIPALPPVGLPLEAAISHLANWIRKSIEWLVAYGQLDQAFTRVVSARAILGREAWGRLTGSRERYSAPLQIPEELFTSHDNVRLRGVCATIVGEAGVVPWTLTLRPPQQAIYLRTGQRVPVDQANLPSCMIGRVENRQSFRPVEICGLISLMNASPIGQRPGDGAAADSGSWLLEVIRPSGTSEAFSNIDDLLIEFNVVGLPRKVN